MAFEGLQGSVSRGATAGANVARAGQGARALRLRERELKAGRAQSRLNTMLDQMNKDREQSLQEAGALAAAAGEMKKNGMEGTPEYQQTIKGVQAALMSHGARLEGVRESMIAGGLDPELVAQGANGSDFVERNMRVFASQIDAVQPEFETLTGDALQEVAPGLPAGSIIQRQPNGKVEILFDPTQAPGAINQRLGLLRQVTDEETAIKVATGALAWGFDRITREAFVKDLTEGGGAPELPAPPPDAPPVVPPGTVTGEAVGLQGKISQIGNILSDTLGLGLSNPTAQQAESALQLVATTSILALQVAIEGRPAKDIREDLEKLTVLPNDIFRGEERALASLKQMLRFIQNDLVGKENALASGTLSPDGHKALTGNVRTLKQMEQAHEDLIAGFDVAQVDVPEGVGTDDAAIWHLLSEEAKALILKQVQVDAGT